MNRQLSPAPDEASQPGINVWIAVLLGHIIVNVPVATIILCFFFVGIVLALDMRLILFLGLLGCALAWLWWSFTVPRWRRWAHRNGAQPDKLQRLAALTGLVWPKGWIFEKTEFRVDK